MLLNFNLILILFGLAFVWLVALSFFIFRAVSHYQKLTQGAAKGNLTNVLEKILKEQGLEKKRIDELIKRAEGIEKTGEIHVQKIGLVRFNPFSATGGDHSFTLAILDGKDSGVVISSLHSRDSTRIYAKPIKEGKAVGYEASKEEKQALERARKGKT